MIGLGGLGRLTQSDAALIGGNGEICLNGLDRQSCTVVVIFDFAVFTDEAYRGIEQSTKHADSEASTQTNEGGEGSTLCVC